MPPLTPAPSPIIPDPGTIPTMPGGSGVQTTNYLESQSAQNAGQSTGTGAQQNVYSPEQQALQSQLGGMYSGVLSGQQQVPAYFTAPQAVFDAYNSNFQKNVAPGIAAQFGGGSPQIGAQQSFGNQQLAAQLYQGGLSNWLNSLGQASQFATTPQGSTTTSAGTTAENLEKQGIGASSNSQAASILALLMQLLG